MVKNSFLRGGMSLCILSGLFFAPAAYALRPFEGTDGSVAEAGVFELEFSPTGFIRTGEARTLLGPFVVANFGFAGDTELVLEGKFIRQQGGQVDGHRTRFGDTAISVKHLFRDGSLQDGTGLSIAAECGVLLPEYHGETGRGETCAGIASQKFDAAVVHFNAGLSRTLEHTSRTSIGVIAEGETSGPARPVMEVLSEHDRGGISTRSLLLGMVWKHDEDLAFDAAVRKARSGGESLTELRFGLTWSVQMHK